MSAAATRAALAVFLIGVLGVWLIRPIGDACPDIGKLPAGSRSSSAPSFVPPLTRTCTYTTAEGTEARQRYVPIIDWLVLAVIAGVVGLGVGLLRPQRGPVGAVAERPQPGGRSERVAALPEPEEPATRAGAPTEPPARRARREPTTSAQSLASDGEDRAAEREREREERARRRRSS